MNGVGYFLMGVIFGVLMVCHLLKNFREIKRADNYSFVVDGSKVYKLVEIDQPEGESK